MLTKSHNNDVVSIDNLDFALYISATELQKKVRHLAADIERDYKDSFPLFLVVLNGAFVFAADLVRYIDIATEVQFIKIKSYDNLTSTEMLDITGLDDISVNGRDVVIIEDIVDSGYSMHTFIPLLEKMGTKSIRLASLLVKPASHKYDVKIDYPGFSIPQQFVVGYGLDYNEHGRNLPQIYQLIDGIE